MRLSLVLYLVFLVLLLDQWVAAQRRNGNGQGTRNAVAARGRSQVQSRIATGTGTRVAGRGNAALRRNRVQPRIVGGNGNRANNRLNRRRLQRARRNRLNRSTRSQNARVNRVNRGNQISARIVGGVEPRIVGGQTASISRIPSLVQVHRSNALCGGILIAQQWVLTAAHCVQGIAASRFYVIGGTSTNNGTDGVLRTVSNIFVAPGFNRRSMNRDAALMKLNATMTGTNIAVARMAQRRPRPGTIVLIGGLGAIEENGSSVRNLRTVQLRVVRQDRCRRAYGNSATITRYMFCAAAPNKDSCSGDSGGGAYQNGRVTGIVSFGIGCAERGNPGVYTKIANNRQWIRNTIANN